jgi:hypothetical protein
LTSSAERRSLSLDLEPAAVPCTDRSGRKWFLASLSGPFSFSGSFGSTNKTIQTNETNQINQTTGCALAPHGVSQKAGAFSKGKKYSAAEKQV